MDVFRVHPTDLRHFLLVALLFICSPSIAAPQAFTATVVDVKDGDTFEIQRADQTERTVRLHGIDAPETGQPFGSEATRYVVERALHDTVTVHVTNTDRYGRLVARIELENGTDLSAQLVRRGLAWWYEQYAPEAAKLQALQQQAQEAGRGLWSQADPIPPREWRDGIRNQEQTERQAQDQQDSGLPYDPNGPDRDCGDFSSQSQAQRFFEAAGGSQRDPHRLDGDGDGVACEALKRG